MSFVDDKKKVLLEHKLATKRLITDKLFLSLLVAIFVLAGNVVVENYRSNNVIDQFALKERMKSALDIRRSFSEMTAVYYKVTSKYCSANKKGYIDVPESEVKYFDQKIDEVLRSVNSNALTLGISYQNGTSSTFNVFRGISYSDMKNSCSYRYFVSDVSDWFTHELRVAVGFKDISWQGIELPSDDGFKEATSYLDVAYSSWKEYKGKS